MKIRNLLKILSVSLLSVMVLSSCDLIDLILEIQQNINQPVYSEYSYTDNGYTLVSTPSEKIVPVRDEGKAGHTISMDDVKKEQDYVCLPSTGSQKVLVIPVYFSDYTPSSIFGGNDEAETARLNIEKTYFGTSSSDDSDSRTGWESVSSFYTKSSYGQLNLSGMVTSWCPLKKTMLEVASLTNYNDPTVYCLRTAVSWFKENYPDQVKDYDQNGDGYLDGVCLIYANDYYSTSTAKQYSRYYNSNEIAKIKDILWAYTYWDYEQIGNTFSPAGNVYTWLSYDFMWDGNYSETVQTSIFSATTTKLVDAHTYIHEFGHMMGLDDYYSYDDGDNANPVGRLDMMDYNIGDHDSYSKYALGWIEPTLVDHTGTYIVNLFEKDGSALLVPADFSSFSYSAFDEYLILELYSPTGLNYADAKNRYCGMSSSYPYMFTSYGMKMYHVDSRLAVVNSSKQYYYTHVNNNLTQDRMHYQTIAASNTPSYGLDSHNRLIELCSHEDLYKTYENPGYAQNKDLFVKGDVIENYEFNDGNRLSYTITITSVDSSSGTATVEVSETASSEA